MKLVSFANQLAVFMDNLADEGRASRDINIVIRDSWGGLRTITGISGLEADPNGDLYVSLETDEVII